MTNLLQKLVCGLEYVLNKIKSQLLINYFRQMSQNLPYCKFYIFLCVFFHLLGWLKFRKVLEDAGFGKLSFFKILIWLVNRKIEPFGPWKVSIPKPYFISKFKKSTKFEIRRVSWLERILLGNYSAYEERGNVRVNRNPVKF